MATLFFTGSERCLIASSVIPALVSARAHLFYIAYFFSRKLKISRKVSVLTLLMCALLMLIIIMQKQCDPLTDCLLQLPNPNLQKWGMTSLLHLKCLKQKIYTHTHTHRQKHILSYNQLFHLVDRAAATMVLAVVFK